MRAQIKRFHSPDVSDLRAYRPADPQDFAFLLQVMVGPEGAEGEESFDIQVCTPQWLARTHEPTEVVFGRHLLIVFQYDFAQIERALVTRVAGLEEAGWAQLAARLSSIGKWEFETYRE